MKYRIVDWQELNEHVETLAKKMADCNFTGVYGLPRGGLVPAVMLSHRLNLPLLMAPCEGCLVVDDIADTGVTLQHYHEKGYEIAVIWWKPKASVSPDFYAVKDWDGELGRRWVVFPWETPPEE